MSKVSDLVEPAHGPATAAVLLCAVKISMACPPKTWQKLN